MKKIKISFHVFIRLFILLLICLFVTLLIIGIIRHSKIKKIEDQILDIHSKGISIVDVIGQDISNLKNIDNTTLVGIDINKNGVRDDVEVEIFNKYPNSQKARATLLQYALSLQMELSQPFLNREIVMKIINEQNRADTCIADVLVPRRDEESPRDFEDLDKIESYKTFIKEKQFNTDERKNANSQFYDYLDKLDDVDVYIKNMLNDKENNCDIDMSILEN